MSITPAFLDQIKERLQLSEIIGNRIKITRAGREFKACCPFHGEKTPSFTINDQKGFYHCFGCGEHGDIISFVEKYDNLDFIEAVEILAHQAGLEVPKQTPQEQKAQEKAKSLYELVDLTATYFHNQLFEPEGRAALTYLYGRGLDDATLKKFRLGYAPQSSDALLKALTKAGFTPAQMIEAGVFRASNRGGAPYGFFRHRVMFPIGDRKGRVVAFGGRLLDGDGPKYINTSDTPLFHKGSLLYNMHEARIAGAQDQPIIVCEGYMDVISLVRSGYGGAVAPNGTALTEEQIAELWRLCSYDDKRPYLCFDGDTAGQRAAIRALTRMLPLLKADHSAKIVFLPDGEDPDSLLQKKGKSFFDELLQTSKPVIDVLWETTLSEKPVQTPEERAGLEKRLHEKIQTIEDERVRHFYQQEIKNRLWKALSGKESKGRNASKAPYRAPSARSAYARKNPLNRPTPQGLVRKRPNSGQDIREKIILATLINNPDFMGPYEQSFAQAPLTQEEHRTIRENIVDILLDLEEELNELSPAPDTPKSWLHSKLKDELVLRGFELQLKNILAETIYLHAGFSRPNQELEAQQEDLEEFFTLLNQNKIALEREKTASALARNFKEEDNELLMAIYDVSGPFGDNDENDI